MFVLKKKSIIAISPLVDGKSIKGPAGKMYSELGIQPSALSIAKHYRNIIKAIVIDDRDFSLSKDINRLGIMPFNTNIIMKTPADRLKLGQDVLNFIDRMTR